jgi:hypothetical protein
VVKVDSDAVDTPKSYWFGALIGAVLGAIVGYVYQHHVMEAKFADMQHKLVSVSKWSPADAQHSIQRLMAIAQSPARLKAVRSDAKSADAQVINRLAQSNVDGFDDLDQLVAPYKDYRDQRVLMALVFTLPGFLLGLFAAVGVERRRERAS